MHSSGSWFDNNLTLQITTIDNTQQCKTRNWAHLEHVCYTFGIEFAIRQPSD